MRVVFDDISMLASESLLCEDALPFYIFPVLGSLKFKTTRDLGELHFQILETPHSEGLFSTLGVCLILLNNMYTNFCLIPID